MLFTYFEVTGGQEQPPIITIPETKYIKHYYIVDMFIQRK